MPSVAEPGPESAPQSGPEPGRADGVVVHVDEAAADKHETVLRNVRNLLGALGQDTPVELVTHGPGLRLVMGATGQADQVGELIARGVTVSACANTMEHLGIGPEQLLPGVRVVPAGVAQLVRRQREGWAYLRP